MLSRSFLSVSAYWKKQQNQKRLDSSVVWSWGELEPCGMRWSRAVVRWDERLDTCCGAICDTATGGVVLLCRLFFDLGDMSNDIVVPSNTREPRDEEVESAVKFAEARTLK
jgi:hypothetical protein